MKFKSIYTGEYVAGHQYVTELVVKRKADYEKESLPFKYWNIKDNKWAKEYKFQVQQCGKLTRTYSIRAIVDSLNKLSWCYSLMNPQFLAELKLQQKKLDEVVSKPKQEIVIEEDKSVKSSYSKKKGIFGKL